MLLILNVTFGSDLMTLKKVCPQKRRAVILRTPLLKSIPSWLIVLPILLLAIVTRFYGFEHAVADGFDDWSYLILGREWAMGRIHPDQASAKPGFILLAALAVKFLGVAETTLPLFNSFLDCVNVLLVIAIARLIGLVLPFASLAGLFYTLLPATILSARSGLAHTSSVTFLLAAVLLAFLAQKRSVHLFWIYTFTFFSGLFSVFAGFIHFTLLPFTFFVFLCLVVPFLVQKRFVLSFFSAGVFVLGVISFVFFFISITPGTGFIQQGRSLLDGIFIHGDSAGAVWDQSTPYSTSLVHYLLTVCFPRLFPGSFSIFILVIVVSTVGMVFYLRLKGMGLRFIFKVLFLENYLGILLLLLAIAHFLVIVSTLHGVQNFITSERLFLPVIPFVVLTTSVLQTSLTLQLLPARHILFSILASVTVCSASFIVSFPFYVYTTPTYFNSVAMFVRDNNLTVSEKRKILILDTGWNYPVTHPYGFFADSFASYDVGKMGYDVNVLQEYIKRNNVAYILYSPVYYGFPSRDFSNGFHSDIMTVKNINEIVSIASYLDMYIQTFPPISAMCQGCSFNIMRQPLKFVSFASVSNIDFLSHIILHVGRSNSFCLYEVARGE